MPFDAGKHTAAAQRENCAGCDRSGLQLACLAAEQGSLPKAASGADEIEQHFLAVP